VAVPALAQERGDVTIPLAQLGEVLPDAEAAPVPGEDDGTHLRVAGVLQGSRERLVSRGVERVQLVGAVQRDRQHRAVACRLDLSHSRPR
jgi:hypothetical protein